MGYPGDRPEAAAQPEWLTLGQAAKYLGVAQSTMRKWSDLGRVSAFYTPGGHRRYRRSDLDRFLDRSGPSGPAHRPTGRSCSSSTTTRACASTCARTTEAEGYVVREAGGAEEALAALGEQSPDLILLDVMMPRWTAGRRSAGSRSTPAWARSP